MSLFVEENRQFLPSTQEPEIQAVTIEQDLIDMDRFFRDYFGKRWEEARAAGRPVLAFGIHETVDEDGRNLLFARTSKPENLVVINPDGPDNTEKYSWSAIEPASSANLYSAESIQELKRMVGVLQYEVLLKVLGDIMINGRKRNTS